MFKKYIVSFSIIVICTLNSFAEDIHMDKYKNVARNIMTSFNIKDYKKFSNDFNQSISDELTEEKIKEVVDGLQNQFGQIKNIGEAISLGQNAYTFLTDFEKGQLNLVLSFDAEDKLSGILFQPIQRVIKYSSVNKDTSIDEIIKPYMSEKNNVGVAIGIIEGRKSNEQKFCFGKTAKDKDKKINNETIFEIGSISKVFTTTILADMYLNKELDLEDSVSKYLPKMDDKSLEYNGRKVNFIDLATHTSGLPRLPEDLGKTVTNQLDPYAKYTKENLFNYVSEYKLKSEPGKTYEYSNLGMGLVGDILANIEKTSYENLLTKHITKKLSMKNTGINFSKKQVMNFATGHDELGEVVPMWNFSSMAGAGAIKSDLNNMMTFLSSNMGLVRNNPLQKAMNLAHKMKFNNKDFELGLGWHISHLDTGDKVIWHNGGTGGFRSFIGFIEDKKIGVVILSNSATSVDVPAMLILKKLVYMSK